MILVLKPHPANGERGEVVDIYNDEGRLPWASVHIDMFHDKSDMSIHDALYKCKKTLKVEITIID